jgi:hypothetical protein
MDLADVHGIELSVLLLRHFRPKVVPASGFPLLFWDAP